MKNSIMLIIALILSSVVDVWAADYDGATKYPATTLVSGQFTLVVAGVVQTKIFSQLHTAMSAAVVTSQRCSCEVLIKSPDIRINTKWKAVAPGEVPITFNWGRPTEREGGEPMSASEVGGYSLVRRNSHGMPLSTMIVSGDGLDLIQYTTTMPYSPTDKFMIAAFDTSQLYSGYVEITPIVGNM